MEASTSCSESNPDFENATDGQELHGYNVMISWYEGEELESMNKTIYGHPWVAYKQPDNSTYLDVDGDGITDIDEIDPANSITESVMEFMEHFKDDQEMLEDSSIRSSKKVHRQWTSTSRRRPDSPLIKYIR